ncbi:porin [Aquamicrobium sp.]|uniref:porin n=1 Tax=Aquamicrobium sp. TaxID=1872579 RepID=UPI00338EF81D
MSDIGMHDIKLFQFRLEINMNIKSLLLGSAAALVAVSGARAADAIVVAEPEPAEYVRICDVYGAGYFYIPGTETCLKIGGYLRYDIGVGDLFGLQDITDKKKGTGTHDTYDKRMRAQLTFDARGETEYGTLRAYTSVYFQQDTSRAAGVSYTERDWELEHAIIQLGGLTIAYTDSLFETLTNSAGSVINDDLVNYTPGKTHLIAYTFDGGNGFSATVGVEEGNGPAFTLDSYVPHVVAGASYTQGWGSIAGVVGYDANFEKVAGKLRLDVNVNEALTLWIMAGLTDADGHATRSSNYATWGGDWAVWGGGQYKFSEKTALNVQLSYDDSDRFGAVVGVDYNIVPGFVIRPEVAYSSWKYDTAGNRLASSEDGWGGFLRFQRSF